MRDYKTILAIFEDEFGTALELWNETECPESYSRQELENNIIAVLNYKTIQKAIKYFDHIAYYPTSDETGKMVATIQMTRITTAHDSVSYGLKVSLNPGGTTVKWQNKWEFETEVKYLANFTAMGVHEKQIAAMHQSDREHQ